MNRKRLGQFLISGVFTACAVAIAALIDLVAKQEAKQADAAEPAQETST